MTNEELFKEIQKMNGKLDENTKAISDMKSKLDEVAAETRQNSVLLENLEDKVVMSYEILSDTNRRVKNLEDHAEQTDTEANRLPVHESLIKEHQADIKDLKTRVRKLEHAAA